MDQIIYRKNYLQSVIARIDFASSIVGLENELPASLSSASLRSFPIQEPNKVVARHLQISPESVTTKDTLVTEWNFYGRDREKQLVIVNQSIVMSYNKYQNYQIFKQDFQNIIDPLNREFGELVVPNRLGIRYINNIQLEDAEIFNWDSYINTSLLQQLIFIEDKNQLSRSFSSIELNRNEYYVRFQFGMHNPDYPSVIRKKHFILDYDVYHLGLLDPAHISENLDIFHSAAQELFEKSITPRFREILNA